MWIVRLALRRPYTFVVGALLVIIFGVLAIIRTPADVFPEINSPVINVVWIYPGMSPRDMEQRIVAPSERFATTVVNAIEHIESNSLFGVGVIKIYFHPGVDIGAANAQVTAFCQTALRQFPVGTTPPLIIQFNATNVPILQLGIASKTLSEQQINDYASNFLRVELATVQGSQWPGLYGGKVRQIMVDLDPGALVSKGISPSDVSLAINAQNLTLPSGTVKLGEREYQVRLNNTPDVVDALNDMPIRQVNGAMVYIRDVAHVHDGFAVQTNVVRENGSRGALQSILKAVGNSTLDVVRRVHEELPRVAAGLPKELEIRYVLDQSIFVRAALQGVLREAAIAACLTALMILLFLGSWRSTLIVATSIPLSILCSIIMLAALGQTLNVMTMGGLALAVGILVDDATVEIENIHRNLGQKKELTQAILDGASQIAVPAFVSTLAICIVFVPVFFLSGIVGSLFAPLAMAVIFAMLASYLLSRTIVPTMVQFLLRHEAAMYASGGEEGHASGGTGLIWRVYHSFNGRFEHFRARYHAALQLGLRHRRFVAVAAVAFIGLSGLLLPFIGRDFFPRVDAGEIRLHVRAPAGTRIEETEQFVASVDRLVRSIIPPSELGDILDNIGLPNSQINLSTSDTPTISAADAEVLISLKPEHRVATWDYIKTLRRRLHTDFPQGTFSFGSADIVSQILNFGIPAPIDVQVVGRDPANFAIAQHITNAMRGIPGAVDVRLQQVVAAPELSFDVDRSRAALLGLTQQNVATSVLTSLSSTVQAAPNYWLSPKNGIVYSLVVQTPPIRVVSLDDVNGTSVGSPTAPLIGDAVGASRDVPLASAPPPEVLGNVASMRRTTIPLEVSHYNVQPVYDVFAATQDRDLGSVAADIDRVLADARRDLPRGTHIVMRGQVLSMRNSFTGLGAGLTFAILLVYLLMVVNFQSWSDPFIIIMALPGALAGILWALFATHTTFSVPSLMGAIMAMGVATANSILLVTFANDRHAAGRNAVESAADAGFTRLRPVVMTALAMIIGMLPMALGLGEGGEQNAPLGRAVIGGLMIATVFTLFVVPVVYSVVRGRADAAAAAGRGGSRGAMPGEGDVAGVPA
jgi:multidrug efflux pump subunit AcrB